MGHHDRDGKDSPLSRLPVESFQRALARIPERAIGAWHEPDYAPADEAEHKLQLLDYWRIIYKRKWTVLLALWSALAVGIVATILTKPIYTANTTIEIDREANTANVVGVRDAEPVEQMAQDAEFFQTQYGLLKSRSLAERVAQSLGLANDTSFLSVMGALPKGGLFKRAGAASIAPGDIEAREKWATSVVEGGLGIHPVTDSRLVDISFDSPNPDLSARIANAVAENFIASNLERRFESSAYARGFLEKRLAQLKARLEDSERQLVAYATKKQIFQVAESGGGKDQPPPQSLAAANLTAFDTALTAAKANAIEAEQKWRSAQGAAGLSVPEILADPTVQALRQEKAKLLAQYEEQLKTYKPDYPDMLQLKARMDDVDRQLNGAADVIRGALRTQYQTALSQVNKLQAQVDTLKNSVLDLRNREIRYNILQREVDTNRTLYEGLLQRYKEIGVAGGISTNNVSVVDRAEPPSIPSQPRPLRNMLVAGISGLALGIMLAFLLETMDQAIRNPRDVEEKLGLPVFGSVPLLEKGVQPVEALANARSSFSEAYFSIRSALGFSTNDGAPRTLAITSARPQEGKTTTAIALAQSFARLGMRVLLIDLDLRNPGLHKALGADNRIGASNVLTGSVPLSEAIQKTEVVNLFVVPSGPLPPVPAELLAGPRLAALAKEVTDQFDMLIMDAPPVMGLADAPLISSVSAGTLLAVEAARTSRGQARAAIRRLRMANAHLLGVVLTKFDARKTHYGYGYSYAYAYEYDYTYGRKPSEEAQPSLLSGKARVRTGRSAA